MKIAFLFLTRERADRLATLFSLLETLCLTIYFHVLKAQSHVLEVLRSTFSGVIMSFATWKSELAPRKCALIGTQMECIDWNSDGIHTTQGSGLESSSPSGNRILRYSQRAAGAYRTTCRQDSLHRPQRLRPIRNKHIYCLQFLAT